MLVDIVEQVACDVACPKRTIQRRVLEKGRQAEVAMLQERRQQRERKGMTGTTRNCRAQLLFVPLDPQLVQEFHPLGNLQPPHRILQQVRGRMLARPLRRETRGEQDAAGAGLAVERIDPFIDTRTIWERVSSLPVEQVFELIEDDQAR